MACGAKKLQNNRIEIGENSFVRMFHWINKRGIVYQVGERFVGVERFPGEILGPVKCR